jgi:hypothetical protein
MAEVLVKWPLETVLGWSALTWLLSCGLLAWKFRARLEAEKPRSWKFPTRLERRRRAGVALRTLFLTPTADSTIRILRAVALAAVGLFLMTFLLEGVVIHSPFRSMMQP